MAAPVRKTPAITENSRRVKVGQEVRYIPREDFPPQVAYVTELHEGTFITLKTWNGHMWQQQDRVDKQPSHHDPARYEEL
jgi:hypothetical protein